MKYQANTTGPLLKIAPGLPRKVLAQYKNTHLTDSSLHSISPDLYNHDVHGVNGGCCDHSEDKLVKSLLRNNLRQDTSVLATIKSSTHAENLAQSFPGATPTFGNSTSAFVTLTKTLSVSKLVG